MNQILNADLGFSIISLASKLHFLDTITAQHIINLFVTMVNTDGCVNRSMVQGFLRQVFLKYLHIAWSLISLQVREDFSLVEVLCPPNSTPAIPDNMDVEFLEYLVDSLCDLLSNVSFLPSIFASFDCNPSSENIAQSIVGYVSNLTR